MKTISFGGKNYDVDELGFLLNFEEWDEDFATGAAPNLQLSGLTEKHWSVIRFIRDSFKKDGACPLVYQTCKANSLSLNDLKQLFPTGYQRGACKLAGISYKERLVNYFGEQGPAMFDKIPEENLAKVAAKIYRLDVFGFLVDPEEWDETFAVHRALEMKVPGGLVKDHWKIINFIRDFYKKDGVVPTIYQTCEANYIHIDDMEKLFPDGYHRGAVKIAGLRVR